MSGSNTVGRSGADDGDTVELGIASFRLMLHDLSGPLAAIVMNARELVAGDDVDPMDQEIVDDIVGSADEMLARIDAFRESVLRKAAVNP